VKTRIMIGGIILIAFLIVPIPTLTLALNEGMSKAEGLIMSIDIKKKIMVVNEKTFIWDKNSTFYNEKESEIDIDRFKSKSYVFIEGEKGDKYIVIKKIYLFPKYLDKKERRLYPFMQ
jgi:hypothetical protein